jgi:parvulin-like peptidyl-prolyl isomerase
MLVGVGSAQDRLPSAVGSVNGQPIPLAAVERAMKNVQDQPARERMRQEVIEFLVETALVDQYLERMKIAVEQKELQDRMDTIKKEIVQNKQVLAKVLEDLQMTETEFMTHVSNDLRWEKFCLQQTTDSNLKNLFEKNPEMFDGSQVRARHILITVASDDVKLHQKALEDLVALRKQIEAKTAEALSKLPTSADVVTREQERTKKLEEVFGEVAREKSDCPSKRDGGDLQNWFPRFGSMVEPFSQAAFALKPFELSAPVKTSFGYHLILVTGRKPGQSVKFDEVKEAVREVYCNKLREAVISAMKPQAKIVIYPTK